MNIKNIAVPSVVALVVAVAFAYFNPSTSEVIKETVTKELGAAGQTLDYGFIEYNRIGVHYRNQAFVASTTPCSVQSPAATSTLLTASWNVQTSTNTALTLAFATSTTAFATTTNIKTFLVGAGSQFSFNYVPVGGATTTGVFAPSTWLVLDMNPNTGGYNPATLTGSCKAMFQEL